MKREFILYTIIAVIILNGCGGLYYFDFHLDPEIRQDKIKISKVLFIEDINSGEAYRTQRIVFRKSPFQVEYFTFRQWAERPEELIKNAIFRFYRNSSIFRMVIKEYSSIEPEIALKANIYSLEMKKEQKEWFACLAVDLEFINKKTDKVIMSHSFDRKEKIKGKKARYLPEKISLILREELLKAAEKLVLIPGL